MQSYSSTKNPIVYIKLERAWFPFYYSNWRDSSNILKKNQSKLHINELQNYTIKTMLGGETKQICLDQLHVLYKVGWGQTHSEYKQDLKQQSFHLSWSPSRLITQWVTKSFFPLTEDSIIYWCYYTLRPIYYEVIFIQCQTLCYCQNWTVSREDNCLPNKFLLSLGQTCKYVPLNENWLRI